MEIIFLEIELHKHAQSWINILKINSFHLFYIEWDYNRELHFLRIFGFNLL